GVPDNGQLSRVLDVETRPIDVPAGGLALSKHIAQELGVGLGDTLTVEVMQEKRQIVDLPVTMIVDEYIGFSAYMSMTALLRLMGEGAVVSGIHVQADPSSRTALYEQLKNMPAVAGILQT